MKPAEIERALRERAALGVIDRAYLHRALSETPSSSVHGRRAIQARWTAELKSRCDQRVETVLDLPAMSASVVAAIPDGAGVPVRFGVHRWVWREAGLIVREVAIDNAAEQHGGLVDSARRIADDFPLPDAPALGELRAGRGQLASAPAALLASEPPAAARRAADLWHRLWNGRELDLATALAPDPADAAALRTFALTWLVALPDAELLFETAAEEGDAAALLWRLHGHHHGQLYGQPPTGRRLRLRGSVAFRFDGDRVTGAHMVAAEAAAIATLFSAPT